MVFDLLVQWKQMHNERTYQWPYCL